MKWLIALFALLLGGGFWFTHSQTDIAPLAVNAATSVNLSPANAPVIVELFTSEGCSSCPPADRLLTQLAQTNVSIIALSEHVDYWNYIGWADPFSSPAFSERQRQYAETFGTRGERGGVYTPQMVVDGYYGFVGSNAAQAQSALAQAAQSAKANVEILPTLNATDKSVSLRVSVTNLPKHEAAELMLALTEDNLALSVTRGENSGRRLPHSAVTRLLKPVAEIAAQAQSFNATTNVKLNDRWQRSSLRVVAFVQERTQRRIIGAATTRWPDK
jgi:hypothetical protein